MKKRLVGVALVLAAVSLGSIQPVEACTRAVYIGPDQMVERRYHDEYLCVSTWYSACGT